MTKLPRTVLTIASLSLVVVLSGCCVTSITSRKVCGSPAASCDQVYEQPIPQGIDAMEAPMPPESLPQEVLPPAPTSSKPRLGTKTTQMMRSFGDQMRDTFTRS